MSIENVRYAVVNRSSYYIPVYSSLVESQIHTGGKTAGGTRIGRIYPKEFYTIIPNASYYVTSFKIWFRDGDGVVRYGYIETSEGDTLDDYPWLSAQEPFHYYNSNGSNLVAAETATISGNTYRVFTVKNHPAKTKKSNGEDGPILPVGTKIATNCSTTGSSYHGHMLFRKMKSGSSWVNIGSESYVFVDLGMSYGTMPDSRNIR